MPEIIKNYNKQEYILLCANGQKEYCVRDCTTVDTSVPIVPFKLNINNGVNISILIFSAEGLDFGELLNVVPSEASRDVTWELEFVSGDASNSDEIVIDPVTGIISGTEMAADSLTIFNVIVTSNLNPLVSEQIVLTLEPN